MDTYELLKQLREADRRGDSSTDNELESIIRKLCEAEEQWRWFHECAKDCSLRVVEKVIVLHPKLLYNKNPKNGKEPFHIFAEQARVTIVRALLKINPDLCYRKDGDRKTALHIAAEKGHLEVINALIEAEANSLWETTSNNETALHFAAEKNQQGAFFALMEAALTYNQEAIFELRNSNWKNVYDIAVEKGQEQIIRWLLGQNKKNLPLIQVASRSNRAFQTVVPGVVASYKIILLGVATFISDVVCGSMSTLKDHLD